MYEYMSTDNNEDLFPAFLDEVPFSQQFAYWLRVHRERLGLSCADMSRRCGLNPNIWARLENFQILNPSWLVLNRVAEALETSPQVLFLLAGICKKARQLGLR